MSSPGEGREQELRELLSEVRALREAVDQLRAERAPGKLPPDYAVAVRTTPQALSPDYAVAVRTPQQLYPPDYEVAVRLPPAAYPPDYAVRVQPPVLPPTYEVLVRPVLPGEEVQNPPATGP